MQDFAGLQHLHVKRAQFAIDRQNQFVSAQAEERAGTLTERVDDNGDCLVVALQPTRNAVGGVRASAKSG